MRISIRLVPFLFLLSSHIEAQQLGQVGDFTNYFVEEHSTPYVGRATFLCFDDRTPYEAQETLVPNDFDLYVDGKKLVEVRQSWPPTALTSASKVIYASVDLPHGAYSIKIVRHLWGIGRVLKEDPEIAQFDLLVKSNKVVNVIHKQRGNRLYLNNDISFLDRWKASSLINKEFLTSITDAKLENAKTMVTQEDDFIKIQIEREQEKLAKIESDRVQNLKDMAEQSQREEVNAIARAKRQALEDKKALAEGKKMEREARVAAEKQRLEAVKEAQNLKRQNNIKYDKICRDYGTVPGSQAYIACRKEAEDNVQVMATHEKAYDSSQKLQNEADALRLKAQLDQQQRQFEELQRQNQEQVRLAQERRKAQAESDQEARAWGALINYGLGVASGRSGQSSSAISSPRYLQSQWYVQGNSMCKYDDGSILNMGSGLCPQTK